MKTEEFDRIDRFAVHLEEILEKAIRNGEFDWLCRAMEKAMQGQDPSVSLNVKMKVELVHKDRENAMRLSSMGFTASGTGEEARTAPAEIQFDGATIQTYQVLGNLHRAPHNVCPNCWSPWEDKMEVLRCAHCRAEMGVDVFAVVENGLCPNCEQGTVSTEKPLCEKCGRKIDPSCVVWR